MAPTRRGVYPGSFDPPTIAHLAIARAAFEQRRLDQVVLAISRVALGKEHVQLPRFHDRVAVLERLCLDEPWLAVEVTEHRLIADIAAGFDVVVMGADKWAQVNDPVFYDGDHTRMRAAVASLPEPAVAPRPPHPVPNAIGIDVAVEVHEISSTAVRMGNRHDWMVGPAADFDARTGAWSDVDRYRRWLEKR